METPRVTETTSQNLRWGLLDFLPKNLVPWYQAWAPTLLNGPGWAELIRY